jgi:hypothetical protein
MEARVYTKKQSAAWIFSDLLSCVSRRGWFSAGPSAEDGKSLLYASFHIHPDDADRLFELIQKSIHTYGGRTAWVLDRQQHNRFILCPAQLESKAKELNNFGKAAEEVRREFPELEHDAAVDLILLSDFIYEIYTKIN